MDLDSGKLAAGGLRESCRGLKTFGAFWYCSCISCDSSIVLHPTPKSDPRITRNTRNELSIRKGLMKIFLVVIGILLVTTSVFAQTQEKKAPESKLVQFQMALLRRGPK